MDNRYRPIIGLRSTTLPTEVIETLLTEEDFEAVLNLQTEDQRATRVVAEAGHTQTDDSGHAEVSSEPVAGEVASQSAAVEASSDPVAAEASSDSIPVENSSGSVTVETSSDSVPVETTSGSATVETPSGSVAVEAEPGPSHLQAVHRKRARDGLMKQAERMVKRSRVII